MRFWKKLTFGILVVAMLSAQSARGDIPNKDARFRADLTVTAIHRYHLYGTVATWGDVIIDERAEWNADPDAVLLMADLAMRKQRLKPPYKKSIGHLVVGQSPGNVELEGPLIASSVTVNSGAILTTNGWPITLTGSCVGLHVDGTLDASGSRNDDIAIQVVGDLHLGTNATYIPPKAAMVIYGTGHMATTITPASYTITGAVVTGTGYTHRHYGEMHVGKVPQVSVVRASYSETGVLLTATGSRTDWITPDIGSIIIH